MRHFKAILSCKAITYIKDDIDLRSLIEQLLYKIGENKSQLIEIKSIILSIFYYYPADIEEMKKGDPTIDTYTKEPLTKIQQVKDELPGTQGSDIKSKEAPINTSTDITQKLKKLIPTTIILIDVAKAFTDNEMDYYYKYINKRINDCLASSLFIFLYSRNTM